MSCGAFKFKSPNFKKLTEFGFEYVNGRYSYSALMLDGQFELIVEVYTDGEVKTTVMDLAMGEPYTLHLVEEASGSFVGRVRTEYEEILGRIADSCFERDVFKGEFAHGVIEYARNTYGDELEFLWGEKIPAGAVLRRKDTGKWYALIMVIKRRKLGLDSDEEVSALDLRLDQTQNLVDGKRYFAGYHMNKRTWFTVFLDGSVPLDEICKLIDKSYELAKKK